MRFRQPSPWRTWIAVVTAYLVFLQALAVASAPSAEARSPLGESAWVICTQAAGPHDTIPAHPQRHGHPTDCCRLGCPMLGGAGLRALDGATATGLMGRPATRSGPERPVVSARRRPECLPLQSRAPPRA